MKRSSCPSCLGRLGAAALLFVAGVFTGVSVTMVQNLEHDESIRAEVRNDAIYYGAGRIELNPVTGAEHFRWITQEPLFTGPQ